MIDSQPSRSCLSCGSREDIAANERIWPRDWECPACGARTPTVDGIPMFAPSLADTINGFDPASFARLATIEATNFWFVTRNALLVGLIAKYFPQAQSFLEIGCGNATVLSAVARRNGWSRLAGSELHPTGLAHARDRVPPNTELVQMDARIIPATAVFDVIGAFDVIEHIEEDETVLREMRQAVKSSGGVIIAVPQHPSLWSQADAIAHHKRRYLRGELEAKLRRNGFKTVFSTSFMSMLLPLMMINRRKAKAEADRYKIAREMELPPALNNLLMSVLSLEVKATLAGLRWPVGGSRVVVASAI